MSSLAHGNNTLEVEVTNISAHDKELFMSYEDFPGLRARLLNLYLMSKNRALIISTGLILMLTLH